MSLRDDKKRWTMREVQGAALDLFEAQGYDSVSVEVIAAAAGVSPPTIYRHFGTKERIVLWDDYDPRLLASIAQYAPSLPPLQAIEAGLIAALDEVYEADARLVLRRSRLLAGLPQLRAAHAPLLAELKAGLGDVLAAAYPHLGAERAELLAGIVLVALETAVLRWVARKGKTPLREQFRAAFADLRSVVATEGSPA